MGLRLQARAALQLSVDDVSRLAQLHAVGVELHGAGNRLFGAAANLRGASQARMQRGQITVAPQSELLVGESAVIPMYRWTECCREQTRQTNSLNSFTGC